jgi:hypothetical protein
LLGGEEYRNQSNRSDAMACVWLDEKKPLCEVVVLPCDDDVCCCMVNNERAVVDRLCRFHFSFILLSFILGAVMLFGMTRCEDIE